MLRIGYTPNFDWLGVAIHRKGIGALEDFVYSRFQLYVQLYFHKTNVAFKWILSKAIEETLSYEENMSKVRNYSESISEFQDFTDAFFWEEFRKIAKLNPKGPCAYLLNRGKLEYLDTNYNIGDFKKSEITSRFQELSSSRVISSDSEAKFSQLSQPYEKLGVLTEDPFTKRRRLSSVNEHSTFFEKFKNTKITHFYGVPNDFEVDI
jgi:deoxynucleoside triphosphate triphosphohydrolase SAMHD1